MLRMAQDEIFFGTTVSAQAPGGGRVNSRLSKDIEARGLLSRNTSRDGGHCRSATDPVAGGNNTKKSLATTLAVICEATEGTHKVRSQLGIRGTRFARTRMSESTQTHVTAR